MNNLNVTRFFQETEINWKVHDIFQTSDYGNCCFYISETFTFANTTWRLLLASTTSDDSESSKFTFMSTDPCKYAVEYSFRLKNPDGTATPLASGSMEGSQKRCENHFIKLKQLLNPVPKVVTFLGTLKARTDKGEPKAKKLKKLDSLSQNLYQLYTDGLCCDAVLNVKGKQFKAHKAVLIARSPIFTAMFQHDTSEKQTGIINVEDCDSESFPEFLKFLYCGKIENVSFTNAYNLYMTSEKYNIQELKTFCREHLMEHLQMSNWSDVYSMADLHEDKLLMSAAQEFFHKNLLQIFKTPEWELFVKDSHQLACRLLKEIPESKIVK